MYITHSNVCLDTPIHLRTSEPLNTHTRARRETQLRLEIKSKVGVIGDKYDQQLQEYHTSVEEKLRKAEHALTQRLAELEKALFRSDSELSESKSQLLETQVVIVLALYTLLTRAHSYTPTGAVSLVPPPFCPLPFPSLTLSFSLSLLLSLILSIYCCPSLVPTLSFHLYCFTFSLSRCHVHVCTRARTYTHPCTRTYALTRTPAHTGGVGT